MKRFSVFFAIISCISIIIIQNAICEEKKIIGKNWDDPNVWNTRVPDDQRSEMKLAVVKDLNNDVLKVTYNLVGDGAWAAMIKSIKSIPFLDTPIIFNIKAKANSTMEIKMIDNKGAVFGTRKNLTGAYHDWTQVVILFNDLSYWWGGEQDKFNQPNNLEIVFTGKGNGTVFFKNIGYGEPIDTSSSALSSLTWDDMSMWENGNDGDSIINISQVSGKIDKALKINYILKKDGGFVYMAKGLKTYLTKDNPFTFYIKAESTATLEVKFVDKDGSNFGTKLSMKDKYKDWTPIILSLDDIEYMWGGDEKFDQPIQFIFAMSGQKGSKGSVLLNQIGFNTIK